MSRPNKKGPVGRTTETPQIALQATVQPAYFRSRYQRKEIDLVTVPRIWIADTIELLIDSLDYADNRGIPHNGREDSL